MEMKTENKTLTLVSAPEIEGLSFRRFRGEEDYPVLHDIYKATMEADGIEASDTLEDFANNYSHLTRCNPATDMLLAEVNGEPISYARCWWDKDMDGNYGYGFFINLKPEWRGTGIGNAMAKFLMKRLVKIARQHPAEAEKYYQAYSTENQKWQSALLESLGYKIIRYGFEMLRPCSEPVEVTPLPEGIVVRTPAEDEYRKVWEADHEAFRDHFGYSYPGEDRYYAWLNESTFNPDLWMVAWDGDEIAGQVLNFVNEVENEEYQRQRGYTEDISTRRPWRRQGIARALLTRSIKMFQEMGMEETALGVDAENPLGALQLYESVGYKEHRRSFTFRKDMNESLKKDK